MLAKFLRQIQQISSDPSGRCSRERDYVYRLPFRFIIPHELISARSDIHPDFLKLCPSARLGQSFIGPATGRCYRQPIITYMIRVTRIRTNILMRSPVKCREQREIFVMPFTSAAPPLETAYFPGEYKCYTSKTLRQHMWSRSHGDLQISAREPSPLNLSTIAPRSSSVLSLKLAFTPRALCEIYRPPDWKVTVKYYLRSRTFFSTRKLDRIPTAAAMQSNQFLGMRDHNTASEIREYATSSWRRDEMLDNGVAKGDRICLWTTTLNVPVNASKNLLPTFLNPLSARQYAVVLTLTVYGFLHGVLRLVIPVQVICYPSDGTPSQAFRESETSNARSASL